MKDRRCHRRLQRVIAKIRREKRRVDMLKKFSVRANFAFPGRVFCILGRELKQAASGVAHSASRTAVILFHYITGKPFTILVDRYQQIELREVKVKTSTSLGELAAMLFTAEECKAYNGHIYVSTALDDCFIKDMSRTMLDLCVMPRDVLYVDVWQDPPFACAKWDEDWDADVEQFLDELNCEIRAQSECPMELEA